MLPTGANLVRSAPTPSCCQARAAASPECSTSMRRLSRCSRDSRTPSGKRTATSSVAANRPKPIDNCSRSFTSYHSKPHTAHRLDVRGITRVVVELTSEVADVDVHRLADVLGTESPHGVREFRAAHQPSGSSHQHAQDLELLTRQRDLVGPAKGAVLV